MFIPLAGIQNLSKKIFFNYFLSKIIRVGTTKKGNYTVLFFARLVVVFQGLGETE